jgi:hypothetical protein
MQLPESNNLDNACLMMKIGLLRTRSVSSISGLILPLLSRSPAISLAQYTYKTDANVSVEVERKFCLTLVDKMQLRLSRMSDTVTRHERSLLVCRSEH